ncbi:O-methyltransferase [Amycolatopsis sp. lyj-23]|uniref:O-methyltransferase n=1 Tax=Amycolatopsis sp. lyj-23 TaxID=2789283 RepID=UPI00397B6724
MASQLLATSEVLTQVSGQARPEDAILRELREETASLPTATRVSAEEGRLLEQLVELTRARTVVEVGTSTGYRTLCIARSLPRHGLLITCDTTARWPALGRPHWRRAGVADRIDLRIAPAAAVLDALFAEYGPGTFDLVFLAAGHPGSAALYDAALTLLSPDGILVIAGTPPAAGPTTSEFDRIVRTDPRVETSLLPTGDGLTLVRKAC